ncbi:hypothetical protein [Herbinix luporum]|uniref:Putative membrane protein n=1 Tax=Herbinix luporum TaxID=1679721 RepID=A0A0K8J384_9FIRM|nr:hypothetical protein [Herbinix luporum]MDI9488761.1 hypothetical protein [Bacillota bacterium]CUH92096.1 putative membrane protein [Herbinix luporum]HHT57521.1 hypothetical protein [Herbinix luporum]
MKKINLVYQIGLGGILTSITVILQSAPVFLPIIGLILSPFSTLPVALAALINVYLGLGVFTSSLFILLIVSIQEGAIFLFATGILGIVLGSLLFRKGILITILASSLTLSIGMILLTLIVAIPGFVYMVTCFAFIFIIIIYLMFSLAYVSIWTICFRRLANYLFKINIFGKFYN